MEKCFILKYNLAVSQNIHFENGFLNFFGSKDQDKWVVQEIFKFKKNGYF